MERVGGKEPNATLLNRRIGRALLDETIDRAMHEVQFAEAELVLAVHRLTPVAIGDKQLVTALVARSFQRLRRARRSVADLERFLSRLESSG